MVEGNDQVKAIGGYFELADCDCKDGNLPVAGVPLNTCRNALEYILRQLNDVNRIFLPYYTCSAVVEPLKKLGLRYEFYHINQLLEINKELMLGEGDYLIANNYFGIKDAYVARLADRYGEKLIIDNAQALFAPVLPGIKSVYSTRKFVGVADGGFAVGTLSKEALIYDLDDSATHNSHLLIRKMKGAEAGFKDYQKNELKLDNQPIRRMSTQTQSILSQINYRKIIERRRRNYQYLYNALGNKNLIQPPSIDDFVCPMVYPFMTNALDIRNRLIKNKVFVAKYWANVLDWCNETDLEYKFSTFLLPLPIDQRYDEKDMKKIFEILRNI